MCFATSSLLFQVANHQSPSKLANCPIKGWIGSRPPPIIPLEAANHLKGVIRPSLNFFWLFVSFLFFLTLTWLQSELFIFNERFRPKELRVYPWTFRELQRDLNSKKNATNAMGDTHPSYPSTSIQKRKLVIQWQALF